MHPPKQLTVSEAAATDPLKEARRPSGTPATPYEVRGVRYRSQRELARAFHLDPGTLRARLKTGRWTLEEALGLAPAPQGRMPGQPVTVAGQHFPNMTAACRAHGVRSGVFFTRLRAGWTLEEALGLASRAPQYRPVTVAGVTYPSRNAAAAAYGTNGNLVGARLALGWTPAQAVGLEPYLRAPRAKQQVPKELRDGSTGVLIICGERFVWK
jgi:hypothetical protein